MPKVSVIIPVYNKEKYLADTLRSVLEQPFRDLEVLAINDGSRDGSLAVLQVFAARDSRLRIVDIPNGGVSHARNVGLARARGEWIQFLDGDDRLEPNYLTAAVPEAEARGADILFSDFIKENEAHEPVETVRAEAEGCADQTALCRYFAAQQYRNGFFGFISNKLFRRSLWEASGARFPEGTVLAEDLDFYARLYPGVTRAWFWHGISFRYLQTENNYVNRETVDYAAQLRIHMDIREWFRMSGQDEKYRDILDKKITDYAFFLLFHHGHGQSGKTLKEAFAFLTGNPEIMASVRPELTEGFPRRVTNGLCRRDLNAVRLSLGTRTVLRKLNGVIRKHG